MLNYLCEILEQEDFPRSYAVEFKGPEKRYLPITGLPKKGVNQLFACAVQYPGLHPLMEQYARLAMRQYEQYTNLSDEQWRAPRKFLPCSPWECWGKSGGSWYGIISISAMMSTPTYRKNSPGVCETVRIYRRYRPCICPWVLSMQNMKYSKDYAAWMANAESLDALLEAKIHLSEIVPSGFFLQRG